MLLIALGAEGGMLLLGWGLAAVWGTPLFEQMHLTVSGMGYGLLACVPMLIGLAWVLRSHWTPLVAFRKAIDARVTPLFANCTLLDILLISALAGLGEEVLFRGFMQTALAGVIGLWAAVVLTGIVFGLAHFITITYAVYATVIGVYLGLLLIVFDNLLVPVLAHGVYDFLALGYLVYLRPPAPDVPPPVPEAD